MNITKNEVLKFVAENDVKFVRMAFVDIFGNLKNISVLSEELERAFDNGATVDASLLEGLGTGTIYLTPVPETLTILPWRPKQGRVARLFCDIKTADGPHPCDSRHILQRAIDKAAAAGLECIIGFKSEFYLFELSEDSKPTKTPQDYARYLDVAPLDKGENIRRDICLTLEEMGISPEYSHHEQGHGQNEIDFKCGDAMSAADNLVTYKNVVRTIAMQSGLFASFMPSPIEGEPSSGMHVSVSLKDKSGVSVFGTPGTPTEIAKHFLNGVAKALPGITLFLNPTVNSYERLENIKNIMRISEAVYSRAELVTPDATANPYIALALIISAGIDGVLSQADIVKPSLPKTLKDAVEEVVKPDILDQRIIDYYVQSKLREWHDYISAENKATYIEDRYFKVL